MITIDGPAGVGKSSVARRVAEELGCLLLNTGVMYRAVGLVALRSELATRLQPEQVTDLDLEALLAGMEMSLEGPKVKLGGVDVSDELHSEEVARWASALSALRSVRQAMVKLQRELARAYLEQGQGLVVEGRDTGSYVFPEADHRFFLDASLEERARRRRAQHPQGDEQSLGEWMDRLRARDDRDREREFAPLCVPEGAVTVDTTHLDVNQVVESIVETVRS